MTDPAGFHPQSGDGGSASGVVLEDPHDSAGRRQEILRADPYYPHTAWRTVVAWLAYFFIFLGFAALLVLLIPGREFGWYYVVTTAVYATVSTAMQVLCRRARVQMLENTGQIPPEDTSSRAGPRA